MTRNKKSGIIIFALCYLAGLAGCSSVREGVKGIAGTSTVALEEARPEAIAREIPLDYFTAYAKTLDALKEMKAYIYEQGIGRRMIAIYVSQTDTTPVGIFFKEISRDATQIGVASRSTYAKELVAEKLFFALAPGAKKVDVQPTGE